jgi:hypothetical protein
MRIVLIELHPAIPWAVATLIVALFILCVWRSRRGRGMGFKEVLKNPDFWDAMAQTSQGAEEAMEEAKGWNDETVAAAVRVFLLEVSNSDEAWVAKRVLMSLAPRTYPAILANLGDESQRKVLVKATGTGKSVISEPESPFNRACILLDREHVHVLSLQYVLKHADMFR